MGRGMSRDTYTADTNSLLYERVFDPANRSYFHAGTPHIVYGRT